MANVYGPKIIRNGLVLYLDKYNERSYLGEPTTNLVHYTNLDTGWSKTYNTNIVWNDIAPPDGIDSSLVGVNVVGFNDAGYPSEDGGGYWYNYTNGAPQDPSTQYTVSMYVKTNKPSGSVSISFYTADNSETGRYWSSYLSVSASDGWKRLEWPAFTSASNAQSDSLSFHWNGHTEKLWLCAPQMEANPHATKFIPSANNGTTTTRSATDGWKDLTGNGNHADLTKLTYITANVPGTHNNDFSFDGADDKAVGSDVGSVMRFTSDFSIDAWFKIETAARSPIFDYYTYGLQYLDDGKVGLWYKSENSWDNQYTAISSISLDTWYHAVGVYNHDGNIEMYINGSLTNSSDALPISTSYGWNGPYIGYTDHVSGVWTDGDIPLVKVYNRALTATEVLQNFNAHKGRYGL